MAKSDWGTSNEWATGGNGASSRWAPQIRCGFSGAPPLHRKTLRLATAPRQDDTSEAVLLGRRQGALVAAEVREPEALALAIRTCKAKRKRELSQWHP